MTTSLDLLDQTYDPKRKRLVSTPTFQNSTNAPLLEFLIYFYDFIRDTHPEMIPVLNSALEKRKGFK